MHCSFIIYLFQKNRLKNDICFQSLIHIWSWRLDSQHWLTVCTNPKWLVCGKFSHLGLISPRLPGWCWAEEGWCSQYFMHISLTAPSPGCGLCGFIRNIIKKTECVSSIMDKTKIYFLPMIDWFSRAQNNTLTDIQICQPGQERDGKMKQKYPQGQKKKSSFPNDFCLM